MPGTGQRYGGGEAGEPNRCSDDRLPLAAPGCAMHPMVVEACDERVLGAMRVPTE